MTSGKHISQHWARTKRFRKNVDIVTSEVQRFTEKKKMKDNSTDLVEAALPLDCGQGLQVVHEQRPLQVCERVTAHLPPRVATQPSDACRATNKSVKTTNIIFPLSTENPRASLLHKIVPGKTDQMRACSCFSQNTSARISPTLLRTRTNQ